MIYAHLFAWYIPITKSTCKWLWQYCVTNPFIFFLCSGGGMEVCSWPQGGCRSPGSEWSGGTRRAKVTDLWWCHTLTVLITETPLQSKQKLLTLPQQQNKYTIKNAAFIPCLMLCESNNFIKCCKPNLKFQEVGNNNLVTNISCHKSVLS